MRPHNIAKVQASGKRLKSIPIFDAKNRIIGNKPAFNDDIANIIEQYIESNDFPTLEGLALKLNTYTTTLNDWSKKYKEYKLLHNRLLLKQKDSLINKGLSGESNVIMSIFLLKANHGLTDKPEEN